MDWFLEFVIKVITLVVGLLAGAFGRDLLGHWFGWKKHAAEIDQNTEKQTAEIELKADQALFKQQEKYHDKLMARISELEKELKAVYSSRGEDLRQLAACQAKYAVAEIQLAQANAELNRRRLNDEPCREG